MKAKYIIFIIFRILFGLVFIFSGIVKLYPIEPFEVLITDSGIAGWNAAPFLARLLISFEISVGLLIIINFFPKLILKLTLLTLLIFNIYLLYTIAFRKDINDCGCFGNIIEFTPWQSFIKNIVLILWGYFLFKISHSELKRFKWLIGIIIVLASLAFPAIINPPDAFIDYGISNDRVGEKLDMNLFGEQKFNDGEHRVDEGKVVLAFLSPQCKFCKYAALKLSIIHREQNEPFPLYIVFWDVPDKKALGKFHSLSKSDKIPYKLLPERTFLTLSGSSLPAIFFLEDGIIKKKTGFRTMKPEEIIEFLGLKK